MYIYTLCICVFIAHYNSIYRNNYQFFYIPTIFYIINIPTTMNEYTCTPPFTDSALLVP